MRGAVLESGGLGLLELFEMTLGSAVCTGDIVAGAGERADADGDDPEQQRDARPAGDPPDEEPAQLDVEQPAHVATSSSRAACPSGSSVSRRNASSRPTRSAVSSDR